MSEIYNRTTEPKGAIPRNAQYVLMGGVVALITITSFCSGKPNQQKDKISNTPGLPDLNAIQAHLNGLKNAGRKPPADADPKQLQHSRQELARPYAPVQTQLDPLEEIERQRQARAPFAPSTIVRFEEPEERVQKAVESQLVRREDTEGSEERHPTGPPTAQQTGSGTFLPEREGSLFRIYEGTLVRTELVNRLDGTFTGPVLCRVTDPVIARDGSVLIPPGAKFLGEARRVEERNQRRLAVWFDRLLLPNGYSIPLENAPGLNSSGETGLKGKINNHFLRRFSLAGAIGLLGGLALNGGRASPYGYPSAVTASLGNEATSDLAKRMSDLPTISVPQGQVVNVYVSNDLLIPAYVPQEGSL